MLRANRGGGGGGGLRDVTIRLSLKPDSSIAKNVKGIGQAVRKAQAEAQQEFDKQQEQATKRAEREAQKREKIETQALIRRERMAKKHTDNELREMQRVEREKQKNEKADLDRLIRRERLAQRHAQQEIRIQQEQQREQRKVAAQADRDLMRRGTSMARDQEREIRLAQRTQQTSLRNAQQRVGQERRNRSIGFQEAGMGGIGVAQGALQFGLMHSLANGPEDEARMQSLLEGVLGIEAAGNIARGGMGVARGLGRTGMFRGAGRGATRLGSRVLAGAGSLAGGLGLSGVGAIGGTTIGAAASVAGAGLAAGAGVGLAGYAGFDAFRNARKYGIGGGADPNSYTGRVARMEVGAFDYMAGGLGYDPLGNRSLKRAQHARGRRTSSRIAMIDAQENQRDYDNRIYGASAGTTASAFDLGMENSLEQGRRFRTGREGIRENLATTRSAISGFQEQLRTGLDSSGTGLMSERERLDVEQRIVALRQQELSLAKEGANVERASRAARLSELQGSLGGKEGARAGTRGQLASLGMADAGTRARAGAALSQFDKTKSLDGLSPDQLAMVQQFGTREQQRRLEAMARQRGGEAAPGLAGQDAADTRAISAKKGMISDAQRQEFEEIRSRSGLFKTGRTLSKEQAAKEGVRQVAANVNVSIDIEKGFEAAANKSRDEILSALKRMGERLTQVERDNAANDQSRAQANVATQ